MLRNNELKELTRQLNKSPRTSLLNEEERKAAKSLTVNQETTKEKGKVVIIKKKNKTNE